jgi:hypothetical protein
VAANRDSLRSAVERSLWRGLRHRRVALTRRSSTPANQPHSMEPRGGSSTV